MMESIAHLTLFWEMQKKKKSIWAPIWPPGSITPPLVSLLSELVADEMLLGHLGLLVDLSQHLMHHVEQRTAQAQQLKQQHIVMRVAPYVRPHS